SCSGLAYPFFFQAEDGIRDRNVTGVQTCALPISLHRPRHRQKDRGALWRRLPGSDRQRPAAPHRTAGHHAGKGGGHLQRVQADEIGRASCRERVKSKEVEWHSQSQTLKFYLSEFT